MDANNDTSIGALEQEPQTRSGVRTVMQVLPALVSGGVERGTIDVAEAIVAAGGRAIVVSAGGPMSAELVRARAEHIILPVDSKNPVTIYKNIERLADIIRREKVDIVHARSRAPAWSAWKAAKRTDTTFVTTFHGTYSHGNAFKRWYNSVMVRGERVIAISDFIAGHIRQIYGVPTDRIRVIPRGVDVSRFDIPVISSERVVALAQRWRLPDGMPVVMLPGRLTRWKGQMVFLDAVARLGRRDVQFLMVGSEGSRSGYRAELERSISSRGLSEIVHVIGDCNDMPAAYMLTDVVISASTDPEAFGRVIVEAQSVGRPVVATDHGGARETVLENETGWLVKPGDGAELAQAIEKALSLDAADRARLQDRAVAHVRENYTKALMCRRTLAVYDELLRERTSAR